MLDATGKIPAGIYSDMTDICRLTEFWDPLGDICLRDPSLKDLLPPIPVGNTVELGSFPSCLEVKSVRNESDTSVWEDFTGQHCVLQMTAGADYNGPKELTRNPMVQPRMPLVPDWILGVLPPFLINAVRFN